MFTFSKVPQSLALRSRITTERIPIAAFLGTMRYQREQAHKRQLASFVPLVLPHPLSFRALNTSCRQTHARSAAKRLFMSSYNRDSEFSLGHASEPEGPQRLEPQPDQMDWRKWSDSAITQIIPAIPFPPTQIFMPGEVKQLHLFEARFLTLFETIVLKYEKRCAHVLIDSNRRAMAAIGTVISVKSWRRLDVGIHIEVEGIGRLKTSRLSSSSPFLRGEFKSVHDINSNENELIAVRRLEEIFWKDFENIISLSLELGISPVREKVDTAASTTKAVDKGMERKGSEATLDGDNSLLLSLEGKKKLYEKNLKTAAQRAVNFQPIDFVSEVIDDEMLARRVQGLSFAGWDYFPSDAVMRQRAMEERNTLKRFSVVVKNLKEHAQKLTAQLALRRAFPE